MKRTKKKLSLSRTTFKTLSQVSGGATREKSVRFVTEGGGQSAGCGPANTNDFETGIPCQPTAGFTCDERFLTEAGC